MRWPWQKEPPAEAQPERSAEELGEEMAVRMKDELKRQFYLLSSVCGDKRAIELVQAHPTVEAALIAEVRHLNKIVNVRNAQLRELNEMLSHQNTKEW